MKTGGLILWNATVLCDMSKTSWQIERRFEEAFTLPVIPYGAMVEYHPISAKDQSRLHQFDEKELVTWNIPRMCIVRGWNLERFWLQTWSSWKFWTRQKAMLEY